MHAFPPTRQSPQHSPQLIRPLQAIAENQLALLQVQLDSTKASLQVARDELQSLGAARQALVAQTHRLEMTLDSHQEAVHEAALRLQQARGEATTQAAVVDGLRTEATTQAAVVDGLRTEAATQAAVVDGLRTEAATQAAVIDGLRTEAATQAAVVDGLRTEAATQAAVVDGLRTDGEVRQAEINSMATSVDTLRVEVGAWRLRCRLPLFAHVVVTGAAGTSWTCGSH